MTDVVEKANSWDRCYPGNLNIEMLVNDLTAEIIALRAETVRLQRENERLRAALAISKSPCVYCSLPADEWAKCKDGFPGCARADDAMGCPELGASLEVSELKAENARLREALEPFTRLPLWTDYYPDGPVDGLTENYHVERQCIINARKALEVKP